MQRNIVLLLLLKLRKGEDLEQKRGNRRMERSERLPVTGPNCEMVKFNNFPFKAPHWLGCSC